MSAKMSTKPEPVKINFGRIAGIPLPLINFRDDGDNLRWFDFRRRKPAWKAWQTRRAQSRQLLLFK